MSASPRILGIVNVTEDSFSDGGLYVTADAALTHARALAAGGADIIDLGAAASNPRASAIAAEVEIERLAPVVDRLKREGVGLSIDSFAPATQRWAISHEVEYLNDIHGFARPELYPQLAAATRVRLIVMHALRNDGTANREDRTPPNLFERVLTFFEARIAALVQAGISRNRLILDPGMGLFLGNSPDASFDLLRRIPDLKKAFGLPVLVCVSRKSFLRPAGRKPVEAGAATLAAELFAAAQGVDYIRTHDPSALRDALAIMARLNAPDHWQSRKDFSAMMAPFPNLGGQPI